MMLLHAPPSAPLRAECSHAPDISSPPASALACLLRCACCSEQLGRVTRKLVLLGHWHAPTCGRLPLATVGAAPPVRCALTNDCCRMLISVCFSNPAVVCGHSTPNVSTVVGNQQATLTSSDFVRFPISWETARTVDELLCVRRDAVLAALASSFGLLWPPRPPEAHHVDRLLCFPLASPRLGQGNARQSAPCTLPLPPRFVRQGPPQVASRLAPEQGQGGASGWVAARGSTCGDYPTRSKPRLVQPCAAAGCGSGSGATEY
jgi:hypothetical protein